MAAQLKPWKEALNPEGLKAYKQAVNEREKKLGSFLEFDPDRSEKKSAGPELVEALKDLPLAVKDNIAVKDFHLSCGSKILEGLVSPYSATAVEKLQKAGMSVVGKTNLDEFGMGSSTDNSALGKTNNPWDLTRVSGGSSGGSAAAVAAGLVPLALGSDTGGSIRQPASFCGIYGLKPTYGAISRYGLVAYASSLEVIGALSRDLSLLEKAFSVMKGLDEKDQTTTDPKDFPITKTSVKKIGILKDNSGLSKEVKQGLDASIAAFKKAGFEIVEIDLPYLDYAVPAYYTIASAEASANLARFNGIRYGMRPIYSENPEALVRQSRDQGFGPEVKLRVLLGTYVLRSGFQDQFYLRAQKIRTAIKQDFDRVFGIVDSLLLPVFPIQAFKHGDSGMDTFQQKLADKYTSAANLSGCPGLTIPGPLVNGLPVGMQLMAPAMHEHLLFEAAKAVSQDLPIQSPPDFDQIYS